jgi:cytochrome c556
MKFIRLAVTAALLATALPLSALTGPAAAATGEEVIAERRANFKRIGEISDAIKTIVGAGSATAELGPLTRELDERVKRISGFFPAGSETGGGTKARTEIWSDRDGFNKATANIAIETGKLITAAGGSDFAAFGDQYKATGAACGACHRNYRNR